MFVSQHTHTPHDCFTILFLSCVFVSVGNNIKLHHSGYCFTDVVVVDASTMLDFGPLKRMAITIKTNFIWFYDLVIRVISFFNFINGSLVFVLEKWPIIIYFSFCTCHHLIEKHGKQFLSVTCVTNSFKNSCFFFLTKLMNRITKHRYTW